MGKPRYSIKRMPFRKGSKQMGFMVRHGGRNVKWLPDQKKAKRYIAARKETYEHPSLVRKYGAKVAVQIALDHERRG